MNTHLLINRLVLLRWLIAALFTCCLLPLAGCERPWTTHDLEELATTPLTPADRASALTAAEGVRRNDHTPATLAQATSLLARANTEAASSPAARATQAIVVNRLLSCCVQSPTVPWLAPDRTPDLWAQLNETFNQADARLRSQPPDVATVMVWGFTGTALNRAPEIHSAITLAQTDRKLREALRQDDPTRTRLLEYASLSEHKLWRPEANAVLEREPGNSLADAVGERAMLIVAIPLLAAFAIVWVFTGHSPL